MSILKKKVEIIMLPTEKASNNKQLFIIHNKLELGTLVKGIKSTPNCVAQELYFVDDSPIKEGEYNWVFNSSTKRIYKINPVDKKCENEKVIIATTDKSIILPERFPSFTYLPQPSDSFINSYIKAFNEGNPIQFVMVDYEYSCGCQGRVHDGCEYEEAKLKTDKSNTITITRCKENYSAEEVNKILDSFAERFVANTDTAYKKKDIFDWKIQNL